MTLENVSGIDSAQEARWENQNDEVAVWNGREISLSKHFATSLAPSINLHQAVFKSSETNYVLCKNEKDSNSQADSKDEKQTEVKQSVHVNVKEDKDNKGNSSTKASGTYTVEFKNKDGSSIEINTTGTYERNRDYNDDRNDRLSGEIDASYNF